MTKTDYGFLWVQSKNVNFKLIPEATEDGGFKTYLQGKEGKILFLESDTFEGMFEALNSLAIAFGILDYRVEHKF